MGRKNKYTYEQKIIACEKYLAGKGSYKSIGAEIGADIETIRFWVAQYQSGDLSAFLSSSHNNHYSEQFKTEVAEAYIDGKGSMEDLAIKYHIRSNCQIGQWVKKYTEGKRLETYNPMPEVYHMAARKTSKEERIEIVQYCIDNNKDYKKAAKKYDCSYSQVYSWVKKYLLDGDDGLNDKRGHHKTDDEVDELERLRRENKRLKAQLEDAKMMEILLKKVQEIEGRRYSPKDD